MLNINKKQQQDINHPRLVISTIVENTSINKMEKVNLPIKTKIAAWWIKLIGFIIIAGCIVLFGGFLLGLLAFNGIKREMISWIFFLGLALGFLAGVFSYWISLQLLRKKKLGWWGCIILLFIFYLGSIIRSKLSDQRIFSFGDFLFLIPLILLLLDRKNFWKIAS